ncbi:MAG: N-6 DNA methylase [Planctomycetota bacterium]|nr:N-6 DNA methylase [Planctomycetota bacterium]MDI6787749.1 N-6 DNA methylase [Planctomycetota bacterium]
MQKKQLLKSSQRTPNPIEISIQKTEWTATTKITEWFNTIIQAKNLPIGIAEAETKLRGDKSRPDIVISRSRESEDTICLLEFKPPYFEPDDEDNLKEPARKKATKRQAPYFAISNFQHLILFNTAKVNQQKPLEEQFVENYYLSDLEDLNEIEEPRFRNNIINELERFLLNLTQYVTGEKTEPLKPIDQLLVWRLQDKVNRLARYYKNIVRNQYHKDTEFKKQLRKWFSEQMWEFTGSEIDFGKAARQSAYLLVNKMVFYSALQSKRRLPALSIPPDLTTGGQLQKQLQVFFGEALNLKYETIYSTDFIDSAAFFPDNKELIREVQEFAGILKRYNFATLRYEIVGEIFQHLIPQEERHNLGQYFTRSDIVDLILGFCLKHETDKVLDPACGAGTFLVRAYHHKKLMNQKLAHLDILDTLWGVDIAKFPAHLSTINLAIPDLSLENNYPHIWQDDFFNLKSTPEGLEAPEKWRKVEQVHFQKMKREMIIPRWFDCIVGNPPYTRQEEIPETGVEKTKLIRSALEHVGKPLAEITGHAGIHTYFFVHGWKFIKDKGRFGFIVSNSWLDVGYGKGLQEFFLRHYKIIAVIESKIERWFESADINTCIVILEKCKNEQERDENLTRFVYLKKPLSHFIPPAEEVWAKEKERIDKIKELINTVCFHNELYENEDLRIFPKKQADLWKEGFDKEEGKYVGAKWGKYLRAPEIFFKILQKCKDKLVPLKEVADVRFGIKTGANEFFYLTEEEIKHWGIEKEFWMHKEGAKWVPNYVIKSPRECKSIVVKPEDLKYRVLMIHKDKKQLKGTNVLKYIEWGERKKGFHKRPTCASRERWHELYDFCPKILWWVNIGERFACFNNKPRCFADKMFYGIFPKCRDDEELLLALLNSTLQLLIIENTGQELTGALTFLTHDIWMVEKLPLLDFRKVKQEHRLAIKKILPQISKRNIGFIYEEISTYSPEEISLTKIKPDRRELDKVIMGDILGLTDEEQLEVYRAVVDLVKSRIDKAKSGNKSKKTKEGIDIELLVKNVLKQIGDEHLGKLYKEKILSQAGETKTLPEGLEPPLRIEKNLYGNWRLSGNDKFAECDSELEALFLKNFIGTGLTEIHIPTNKSYLKSILPQLTELRQKIDTIITEDIHSVLSQRARRQVLHLFWQAIMGLEG